MFRRQEKPRRRGVEAMEAHVEELCAAHGIGLAGSSARGRAIRWRGGRLEIAIPPIRGQVSYFIALHEIGHLVGRGRSAPRLEAEANAWIWALENSAFEPTDATLRSISKRLDGYLRWAQNRQHRRVPPRIPPREHAFWSLLTLGRGRQAA
ncbi:MAG TPA: hypothetical protein VFN15_05505 [Solirubrobacterales bacterium]|nr:hypothetical protein [Solirubrobacterales bacterium]